MLILVLNSGSSSIKYQICEVDGAAREVPLVEGIVEEIGLADKNGSVAIPSHAEALDYIHRQISETLQGQRFDAVGHRVVHGGELFSAPALVNDEVIADIESLASLAPLHNSANLLGILAIKDRWPDMPQVAVFDTAFHQTVPEKAWRYAINPYWHDRHSVRRYGFHGTSYEYVTAATTQLLNIGLEDLNAVIAHLGNGASIAAIQRGRSIDTSMGFTPLEGLVMGTRSGDIDPAVVTFMQKNGTQDVNDMLNKSSGLLGLAGNSDMRTLTDEAYPRGSIYAADGTIDHSGASVARTALDIASYRVAKYIGAYHVAVTGAQALVFTAGIGENSVVFRELVVSQLEALNLRLDQEKNKERSRRPRLISTPGSAFPIAVVPTNEETQIAQATARLVQAHNLVRRNCNI